MSRFEVRFFNVTTKETERYIIEEETPGDALRRAIRLTSGIKTQDLVVIQKL